MRGPRSRNGGVPRLPAIVVEVTDRQRLLRTAAGRIGRLVRRVLAAEGIDRGEIGVVLVDDRRIAALHRRWMGVAGPTDVITFDLARGAGPAAAGLYGDIVVSAETARRVAREVGWTPHREVAYYIVHGLLHLAGYDDRSEADRRAMRRRERLVMRACGLPAPPRPRRIGHGPRPAHHP